jgi:type IV secretion system protein VirB10
MVSSPPVTPSRSLHEPSARPAGVLPRHLQTWVVLGTAVVMTAIIAMSGTSRPADRPPTAGVPPAVEANDARIQEYRKRIDEEARRLSAAQAELDLAKRSLTAPPQAAAELAKAPAATTPAVTDAMENERRQKAYHALFADNIALSRRTPPSLGPQDQNAAAHATPGRTSQTDGPTMSTRAPALPSDTAPATSAPQTYPIREGTIIEAILTNRLDGTFVGPVNAMVTADVYAADRRHRLIPQGARLLGEAKAVTNTGQQRLAVTFHRLLLPDGTSVTLDQFKGLSQAGETGLEDQVNHHYAQLFGVSIAIGAIGGLAQINTRGGVDATGADLYRQGVGASLGQSSLHILDRFLNILPTVTIREGQRLKVYLAADLAMPAMEEHHD